MDDHSVTEDSIRRALAYRQQQRDEITARTGVRINEDGVPVWPRPRVRIHCICGLCKFVASAQTEGRALRSLAPHLVAKHGWRKGTV